jgi:hypothetical protein
MTTIAITIGLLVMAAAAVLFAMSLARAAAAGDRQRRRAHQLYLLRYEGGERLCAVCGEPTRYSLHGRPIHPECRKDAA